MINLYDGNNVMRRSMEISTAAPRLGLRMRYNAVKDNDIWVWDGRHHNERRRAIYPKYKVGRTPTPEDIFAQVRLWRELLRHSPATQIEVEGWEADDVIGTLARQLSQKGVPVTVHSNDMDYGQLEHLRGVTLNGVNMKGVSGRWIALYKALRGDGSDKIDGVPGFGPKRWLEMEEHWPQIEQAIVKGSPEAFVGLPFKPAVKTWLLDQANIDLLQAMLTITHFENVPDDEIEGGILAGIPNKAAAHARLSEFFL